MNKVFSNEVVYTTVKEQQAVMLKFGLNGYKLVSVQEVKSNKKFSFSNIALYFVKEITEDIKAIAELEKENIDNQNKGIGKFYKEP